MAKKILYGDDARKAIKAGVDKIANAVKSTLGPRGHYVILGRKTFQTVTNDGVTIAKDIEIPDAFENIGAKLVREISSKTNDVSGDGTTTACVLAQAIIAEGHRSITSGANAMHIKRGIEKAVFAVCQEIDTFKTMIQVDDSSRAQIVQIATVSASDRLVGELIADALLKVGRNGVITVEEGRSADTRLAIVEGMQFAQGYLSPHFVTDQVRMEVVMEKPTIVLIDQNLIAAVEIMPLLQRLAQARKPFLLMATGFGDQVLTTLVMNEKKGLLACVPVITPGFGEHGRDLMRDIATVTGGVVISEGAGVTPANINPDFLGRADKVIVSRTSTVIVGGAGAKKDIDARLTYLKGQLLKATGDFEREKLQERIAKLSGGVAVIEVGASTETEMKAKKFKVEDAMHATKAAVEDGIVSGGGVTLMRTVSCLDRVVVESEGERAGVEIVRRALVLPLKTIAENAGVSGDVVLGNLSSPGMRARGPNFGFNAQTLEYVDMIQAGIIDPARVVKSALENAASIAGLMLATEVLVTEATPDA